MLDIQNSQQFLPYLIPIHKAEDSKPHLAFITTLKNGAKPSNTVPISLKTLDYYKPSKKYPWKKALSWSLPDNSLTMSTPINHKNSDMPNILEWPHNQLYA